MPHPSKKVILTEAQYKLLEEMAKLRLPQWQMAPLIGMSFDGFRDLIERDKRAQHHLTLGRSFGSQGVRRTLYQKAMGERDPNDPEKWLYQPDVAALKFWCQTQEGFKIDHSMEINVNHNGELSEADKAKEIARLLALRQLEHTTEAPEGTDKANDASEGISNDNEEL